MVRFKPVPEPGGYPCCPGNNPDWTIRSGSKPGPQPRNLEPLLTLHMVGVLHTPPQWCSSSITGASQSTLALITLDWCFNISFSVPYFLLCPRSSSRLGAPHSPPWPQFGAPRYDSWHFNSLPFRRCSAWMGCSAGYALLNSHWHSLAWICTPQFHSALLHYHQHSPCPPRTPHQALLLSWWCTSFSHEFIILPFKLHFDSPQAIINFNHLDITNRAKPHWNSISPTRQARIFWKYKERFKLLRAVDEMCVPSVVGDHELGDSVDGIVTMFDRYHSDRIVGLLFQFYLHSLLIH